MKANILNDKLIINNRGDEYIFAPRSIAQMVFYTWDRLEIIIRSSKIGVVGDTISFRQDWEAEQSEDSFRNEANTVMNWFKNNG